MSTMTRKITVIILSLCILFGALSSLKTTAYVTSLNFTGKTIVIDISKSPSHPEYVNLEGNLTNALNTVDIISSNLETPISGDALIITQPTANYTTLEMTNILDFLSIGNKSVFIGGNADFGGYNNSHINILLEFLGSKMRIDSSQIVEPDPLNDGADYRVAATSYGTGPIGTNVSDGCLAGIMMHGTCAILGYDNSAIVDLRSYSIENVEILLSFSENATALNTDGSNTEYDLYSKDLPEETGDYPAVVCETLLIDGKRGYIILAGEVIFSDYKKMYDQYTETGTYNGGIHYGQMFVNNLLNYFLDLSNYIVIEEFSKIHILSLFTVVPIIVYIALIAKKKKYL
jgi:hypothetical protein